MKIVQTSLSEEEYRSLREALARRGKTIREALREAALRLVAEELQIDPEDPFFTKKSRAGSGHRDLSARHDKYLYRRRA